MKRNILTLIFALVMGISSAWAVDYDFSAVCSTGQTLYYKITNSSTHEVQLTFPNKNSSSSDYWFGYQKPVGDIVLPEMVEHEGITYSVTEIRDYAFYNCSAMTGSLTIPNSVTSIGRSAFSGCSGFTGTLTIGNAVTSISYAAFQGCMGFTGSLIIGNSVTSIQEWTFNGCRGFTGSLTIPNSVTSIGEYAFYDCNGFTGSLTIGNSVTSIGGSAFYNCSNFTGLIIGAALSPSYFSQFSSLGKLESMEVSEDNPYCYSDGNCIIQREPKNILKGCKNSVIPDDIVAIGNGAFANCTELSGELVLPNSLISIGDNAFENCTGLNGSLLIPDAVEFIGSSAFDGCWGFTGSLIIPNSVTSIGNDAFNGCSGFTGSLTIPNSVTSIGNDAFNGCSGFTGSLTIPNSVTSIGYSAFSDCSGFTNLLTIGNSVTSIGYSAFNRCRFTFIVSNAVTPPVAGLSCFGVISYSIPVYVPCGSAEAYRQAAEWSRFNNYYEFRAYDINLLSADETMGSVAMTQRPDCETGICTVQATPAAGCGFECWKENGEIVSTLSVYSFEATADRTLTAYFNEGESFNVMLSANLMNAGTLTGAGNYHQDSEVTVSAQPAAGYSFVSWTENGELVSTTATYTFTITAERNLMANFVANGNQYWNPDITPYANNMTIMSIATIDGVEITSAAYEIGAFCNGVCRGSARAEYFAPLGRYLFFLTVSGNDDGEALQFRLYDHSHGLETDLYCANSMTFESDAMIGTFDELYEFQFLSRYPITATVNPEGAGTVTGMGNYVPESEATLTAIANEGYQFRCWTLNGETVSTDATYTFTATMPFDFVAEFDYIHAVPLNGGWNWWSSYIDFSETDGLSILENSLGNSGLLIKSRSDGYVEAYDYGGTTSWFGTLTAISNGQMYKIQTNSPCMASVYGQPNVMAEHPVTIRNGWNWISFPMPNNIALQEALSDFTPEANDVIKGRSGFSTYYSSGSYSMWYGTLNTLESGQGYMYFSNSQEQKSLVYSSGRSEAKPNITNESNVFQPNDRDFADNMNITAVVEIESEELRSENYEVAAFVNGECRGSVKLLYVEPTDSYVAFLTVFGEDGENMEFRLTDGNSVMISTDKLSYTVDGVMGSLTAPIVLHFNMTGVMDNETFAMKVYPNPTNGMVNIECEGMKRIMVMDAFGQIVYDYETSGSVKEQINMSGFANGIYMVRVITDNGIVNEQFIKE